MLHVDKRRFAPRFLGLRHHMQRQGGFTRRFRAVDFHDPAPRNAANTKGQVQPQRAGGNTLHLHAAVLSQFHDRAFAELPFNAQKGRFQRLFPVGRRGNRVLAAFLCCHSFRPIPPLRARL